jgi:TolB-like protein/Tfp pilus assembly protein PilF/tRNA A-37 threonylcarbamoyl transferase component Bud32
MAIECSKCKTKNSDTQKFCGECGTQLEVDEDISITKTLKTSKPPKTIAGKYKILAEIGRGGMGIVYKAKDIKLNRTVALKFLPDELTQDKEAKKRFIQEAQAAAALEHPYICIVYEVYEADDQTFIAMAFIEGQSLRKKIESSPLDIDEAKNIAIQVAEGLGEAHSKGIVHRDIKPANIMLSDKGKAKIMDFGIAKLKTGEDLTKASTLIGTVAYMSPEQARGEEVDHRSDIWSLGAMFYEMLTGNRPFKKDHEQALIFSILNDKVTPISVLRSDIPNHIENVIQKALEKDAAKRFQSMDEFIEYLKSPPSITPLWGEKSLAVLPFENMSADPEQEFFCDGITEEIINALTHVENLRVIARTSTFAFKGKHEDIREIGRKLDVQTLLEGSVRKSGERLRIAAQLINVADGSHIWSDRFDRLLKDVFDIQDEISLAIVDNLKVKLLFGEKESVVERHTDNPEVYNYYLLGRYYWNLFTEEDLSKSQDYFQQALALDPKYAPALAGLAVTYVILGGAGLSGLPSKIAIPKAKEAGKKAIAYDPENAEAHSYLGFAATFFEWNWQEAEKHFQMALQSSPNSALAHDCFAYYLCVVGRHEESIEEIKKALKLDPLSPVIYENAAGIYLYAGQYEKALDCCQKGLSLYPDQEFLKWTLGHIYLRAQKYNKAGDIFENLTYTQLGMKKGFQGYVYGILGKEAKARQILGDLKKQLEQGEVSHLLLALIHLGLDEYDKALDYLEGAVDERPARTVATSFLKVDPLWNPLRSNPRFIAVLRRMGFDVPDAEPPKSIQAETKPSIAVLPFVDMSPGRDQEYFCDGLSESIINSLTQIKDLRVVSRTSAFSFKGKETDIREIGNKLNVHQILEGSLQKAGTRLRIMAQLINVKDGYHLWSERFDRDLSDIFDIQDEISLQITNRLKVKLGSQEKDKLVKRYTEDLEAYNLYLKGRYHWNKTTPDGFYQGIKFCQEAIQKDPAYALAYAGIAFCYIGLGWYYHLHPKEAFPKAREAVKKAMELDDSLSEGQTALGVLKMVYDRDWDGAKEAFERAIELNDGFMLAHSYYSMYLAAQGRRDESIAEGKRALGLDPLTLMMSANLGMRYYYARDFDTALEEFERMLEMDPHFWIGHFYITFAYSQKGMYEKALEKIKKALDKLGRENPLLLASLGCMYGFSNQKDEAEKILTELEALSEDKYVAPFFMALLYISLDQNDLAFEWLERSFSERDHVIAFLKVEPLLDKIRSDPRYTALLKKMNLER